MSKNLVPIIRSPRLGDNALAPVTTRTALSRGIFTPSARGAAALTPSLMSTLNVDQTNRRAFPFTDTKHNCIPKPPKRTTALYPIRGIDHFDAVTGIPPLEARDHTTNFFLLEEPDDCVSFFIRYRPKLFS
jgi:hypothetical protein